MVEIAYVISCLYIYMYLLTFILFALAITCAWFMPIFLYTVPVVCSVGHWQHLGQKTTTDRQQLGQQCGGRTKKVKQCIATHAGAFVLAIPNILGCQLQSSGPFRPSSGESPIIFDYREHKANCDNRAQQPHSTQSRKLIFIILCRGFPTTPLSTLPHGILDSRVSANFLPICTAGKQI